MAPVLFELHFHKGKAGGRHKWYLTDVQRNGPEPSKSCSSEECTVLTVDLWAAEFLQGREYIWIDPKTLGAQL